MFGHIGRMTTIVGGGLAVLVAGEIMLGEKSTPLSHDPELRAMQRAPDLVSELSYSSFCVAGDCAGSEVRPEAKASEPDDQADATDLQSADEQLADFVAKSQTAE